MFAEERMKGKELTEVFDAVLNETKWYRTFTAWIIYQTEQIPENTIIYVHPAKVEGSDIERPKGYRIFGVDDKKYFLTKQDATIEAIRLNIKGKLPVVET